MLTTAPIRAIQPRIAVRVTVAELNIRKKPSTSADILGVVKRGTLFLIIGFAPIKRDGYTWWLTELVFSDDGALPLLPEFPTRVDAGYVAVGSDDRRYVEVLPARCPARVNVDNLNGMLAGERLACFGNRSISLEGVYGCPTYGDVRTCGDFDAVDYRPAWLAHPTIQALSPEGPDPAVPLYVHVPPSLAEPAPGSIIRVNGHFDDDRSESCEIIPGEGSRLPRASDKQAERWCRQHFVFEDYTVLGIDPEFPPS